MPSKLDALLKTLEKKNSPTEDVTVIHKNDGVVAYVEVDKKLTDKEKLEIAFVKTNSIDSPWWENDKVTPMFLNGSCRSTSVGDHALVGTTKYVCDPVGWSVS